MKFKSNPDKYFHQALQILKGLPPFNKLRDRELQIYAELLLVNHVSQFSTDPPRLLAPIVRDGIMKRLNITSDILRNSLTALRKKGMLVEDTLVEKFTLKYLQPLVFEFTDNEET
jgi:hypothetical protein